MTYKVLIDTNILVDAALTFRPESAEACRLLELVGLGRCLGYVSALSLKDFYYLCRKALPDETVRAWIDLMLDTCEVVPVDKAICRRASASQNPDFEDAIVEVAALDTESDYLVSRDMEGFEGLRIPKVSAANFLRICEQEDTV